MSLLLGGQPLCNFGFPRLPEKGLSQIPPMPAALLKSCFSTPAAPPPCFPSPAADPDFIMNESMQRSSDFNYFFTFSHHTLCINKKKKQHTTAQLI